MSDAVFGIKEVDVGQAADLGTPARIIGNASLFVRTFGAEEALQLLGLLSRVVPGLGAEFFALMNPVVIVGTKSCMRLVIRAFCIFLPSVDELIFQHRGF
jgi:hypothetical protein